MARLDIPKQLEAIPLSGNRQRSPERVVQNALRAVSELAEEATIQLQQEQPEQQWTEPRTDRMLTALWLRQRGTREVPTVVAGLLGLATRRACGRYWARNPFGRQSGGGGTVERDYDTFCADTLADVCLWMAEPRKGHDRPRYHEFLDQYLRYMERRPGRSPDPVAWLGDKARKRLRHRLLGPWYRRWHRPQVSQGEDWEQEFAAEPTGELDVVDFPAVVSADGRALEELVQMCLAPALGLAWRVGRELDDPDCGDAPVRCFLLYTAMRDFSPAEREAIARAAGFEGKRPEAALRMQYCRADRALHRLVAALLDHRWKGLEAPSTREGVATAALHGLREAGARGVLSPSEAEVFGFWCQVDPRGESGFAECKRRLGLGGPAAVGKLVSGAKVKLTTALPTRGGPPATGKENEDMSLCCPKGKTYDDWVAFGARKPDCDRQALIRHVPGCDACMTLLTLAEREHDETIQRRAVESATRALSAQPAPVLPADIQRSLPRALGGRPDAARARASLWSKLDPANWAFQPGLLAGAAAAAALLVVVVIGSRGGPDRVAVPGLSAPPAADSPYHPKGLGSMDASLLVYRTTDAGAADLVDSTIAVDDRLAFAYTNPTGKARLLVFGVDDEGNVFWYHPLWQRASENPTAVAVTRTDGRTELPVAVRHELEGRKLWIHGIFTDQELSVREVESLVGDLPHPSAPLPLEDAIQVEPLQLEVRPTPP